MVEENLVGKVTTPLDHYDLIEVILVCLSGGDIKSGEYKGLLKLLDVLLSSEAGEAKKRQVLEEEFDIPMTETLEEEVLHMCDLSRGVMEKGIAKGRAEGITDGIFRSLKNLIKNMNVSIEQAMAVLEIPAAEQQRYADLLEQQP